MKIRPAATPPRQLKEHCQDNPSGQVTIDWPSWAPWKCEIQRSKRGKGNKRTKYEDVTPVQPLNIFPGLSILETSLSYCPLCPISVASRLEPGKTDPRTDRMAPLTSAPAPLHLHPGLSVPGLFIFLCCLF